MSKKTPRAILLVVFEFRGNPLTALLFGQSNQASVEESPALPLQLRWSYQDLLARTRVNKPLIDAIGAELAKLRFEKVYFFGKNPSPSVRFFVKSLRELGNVHKVVQAPAGARPWKTPLYLIEKFAASQYSTIGKNDLVVIDNTTPTEMQQGILAHTYNSLVIMTDDRGLCPRSSLQAFHKPSLFARPDEPLIFSTKHFAVALFIPEAQKDLISISMPESGVKQIHRDKFSPTPRNPFLNMSLPIFRVTSEGLERTELPSGDD